MDRKLRLAELTVPSVFHFLSLWMATAASVMAKGHVQQHACMFASCTSKIIMEVKERRPYCSLTKSRKEKEARYTGSSVDSEECVIGSQGLRVPTQKSYSSSETLRAFDQHQDQTRLLYGTTKGHKEMVHREQDDYSRQGQHFSLRQLGICEPPPRRGLAFCSDIGLPHRGFSVGTAQDTDPDSQAVMSPERAMRLWGRGGLGKSSGRSSCLSSRSNSVLTLTDTEHENKSDSDNVSHIDVKSMPGVCDRQRSKEAL
ncbi:Teneurin-3 [Oryzias melastigma]|uniref:Teneurin-3 n=1 Tax=Oryzias melastigma TaxID=30732 RepID=A0A834FQN2_ORYME|nr:Teneurin-3 [Oryzias melastigma]